MNSTRNSAISHHVEDRAKLVRDLDLTWKTGIYPAEMAFFLGLCDYFQVDTVVESGRGPDAYSTMVLGEYARNSGVRVISLDLSDPSDLWYGDKLAGYESLTCLTGDSFKFLPKAMSGKRIALLVDGPKTHRANVLSLAATYLFPVALIAHHNCDPGTSWGDEFREWFADAVRYEDILDSAAWHEFKQWEVAHVDGYEVFTDRGSRNLASSSLTAAIPKQHFDLSAFRTATVWRALNALGLRRAS